MGCLSDRNNLVNNYNFTQVEKNVESYTEPNNLTFDLVFYKLSWKSKPTISIYQKIDEETLDKIDISNTNDLFQISQIEEMKLVPQLQEMKNVLFFLYCKEGVAITGNLAKLNYFFKYQMKILIKICVADISSIIITGSEYNSIREIKNQSKFYFDLNQKEINFTNRNVLINEGKNEELSETDLNLDDELLEELENNKFEQHIHTSECQKDEKEFVYEYNEDEKDISKLSIEKMINKKVEYSKNNEIEYIETNANENNLNANEGKKEEKLNYDIPENKIKGEGYEVRGNCLIISMTEMCEDSLRDLKRLFFVQKLSDEWPYIYLPFYNEEEKSKMNKNKNKSDFVKEKEDEEQEINDYIQIFKKDAVPFEKRTLFDKIKKIIFQDCNFNKRPMHNLKDFFTMLFFYPNLKKIAVYENETKLEFPGWKYLKQLLKENFNIRWVSFKGANLNDTLFEDIILGMTLKRIRYLNLSRNRITNKGLYFLNKFLMKNQTLLILDLSHNYYVNSEGIKLITNALKMHPNIKKVDLSYMKIKGSGHYISNFIRDNKCLESLNLRNCLLEKQDIDQFPTVFSQKDCQMKHLDLGLNVNFGEDGLKEIGKLITNNKSLVSIGLDGINLTMNNYMPVFQGILKNKTLKSYSLNLNPGLPLKGILNFFLKNPYIKEISLIPWDFTKDKTKKFTESQLQLFERFHKKAPDVVIKGIYFY